MNSRTQAMVLLLFGVVLLRLGISDLILRLLRPAARPWVVAAGVAIVLLAGWALVATGRSRSAPSSADPTTDHDHARPSRVAWLILAPIVAVLVVEPPALGAYTADRQSRAPVTQSSDAFGPLRGGDPVQLSVVEFALRALDHDGRSLRGRTVDLTGFVARVEPRGYVLVRLVITCCAADALPVEVHVRGNGAAPARETWVRVVGRYAGTATDGGPVLRVGSTRTVPQPRNPYDG